MTGENNWILRFKTSVKYSAIHVHVAYMYIDISRYRQIFKFRNFLSISVMNNFSYIDLLYLPTSPNTHIWTCLWQCLEHSSRKMSQNLHSCQWHISSWWSNIVNNALHPPLSKLSGISECQSLLLLLYLKISHFLWKLLIYLSNIFLIYFLLFQYFYISTFHNYFNLLC